MSANKSNLIDKKKVLLAIAKPRTMASNTFRKEVLVE